jgi:antitoxin PrlF
MSNNGKVIISLAQKNDSVLRKFLSFIANDIAKHPENISAINPTLIARAKSLTAGVAIDLDAALMIGKHYLKKQEKKICNLKK